MKKVALSLLAFGLVGAMAFADNTAPTVAIHEWGRTLFTVGNQGSGYFAGPNASWYSNPRIVGLNITADSPNVGFSITPSADNGSFGLTDQNKVWIRPIDGVTLETGIDLETDTWRGTGDFGSWDWNRPVGTHGDTFTFSRIGENSSGHADFQTAAEYNKDGIGAWVMVSDTAAGGASATTAAGQTPTQDFGHSLQAGAAYTIAGIGVIKAQVIGYDVDTGTGTQALFKAVGSGDQYSTIQAAFNLTAVQNLYEEIGVWLPTDASHAGWSYQVSDVLSYKLGAPTVHVRIAYLGYNDKNNSNTTPADNKAGIEAGAGVDYALDGGVTLNAAVDYVNQEALDGGNTAGTPTYSGDNVAFLAGVTKGFSNGLIGIGFQYSVQGFQNNLPSATHAWNIPVRFEEWF